MIKRGGAAPDGTTRRLRRGGSSWVYGPGNKGYRFSETWVTVLTEAIYACRVARSGGLRRSPSMFASWVVGTSPTGYPDERTCEQFEDLAYLKLMRPLSLDAADLMFGRSTRWAAGPRGRDADWVGIGLAGTVQV